MARGGGHPSDNQVGDIGRNSYEKSETELTASVLKKDPKSCLVPAY